MKPDLAVVVFAVMKDEIGEVLAKKDNRRSFSQNEFDSALLSECWWRPKELDALLFVTAKICGALCNLLEAAVGHPDLAPTELFANDTEIGKLIGKVALWAKDYAQRCPPPSSPNPNPLPGLEGLIQDIRKIPSTGKRRSEQLVHLAVLSGCYKATAEEWRERLCDALKAREELANSMCENGKTGLEASMALGEVDTKEEELAETRKKLEKQTNIKEYLEDREAKSALKVKSKRRVNYYHLVEVFNSLDKDPKWDKYDIAYVKRVLDEMKWRGMVLGGASKPKKFLEMYRFWVASGRLPAEDFRDKWRERKRKEKR